MDAINNRIPSRTSGWKSVDQLRRERIGDSGYTIKIRLEKLTEDIKETLITNGLTELAAQQMIADRYVRKAGCGLYASPEAIEMLEFKYKMQVAPKSWRSASELSRQGEARGCPHTILKKIRTLHENLVNETIDQANVSRDEASELVDQNLVGRRRTRPGNDEGLYASPEALRILYDTGLLVRGKQRKDR